MKDIATSEPKRGLIACELGDLGNTISNLADSVEKLAGMLEPIRLSIPAPTPHRNPLPEAPTVPLPKLAEELQSFRGRIGIVIEQIREIQASIEL